MDLVRTGSRRSNQMIAATSAECVPHYRATKEVPLIQLERFCHCMQAALADAYSVEEIPAIWRLYISAECSRCGIRVFGDELRALSSAPCAELASAKTGRMRLGDCARSGCQSSEYSVHFWNQELIDWPSLLKNTERLLAQTGGSSRRQWTFKWTAIPKAWALRAGAVALVSLGVLVAREYYLGGRIPWLREPEKFQCDRSPYDEDWPTPLDCGTALNFVTP